MNNGKSNSRKIQFANYRLDQLIGSGGFARVYKGWDSESEMQVAIKIVDAYYPDSQFAYATDFLEHTSTLSSWRHKNIIKIHRAGFDDNYLYLVMEYVDGTDLADVITRYGEDGELVPHDDVIQVARSVVRALEYAHRRQVLHLDVKPSNILMERNGRVILTDFNLPVERKKEDAGMIFGSAHYMAPEQSQGINNATPLSDLYSLGVIIFEMLTGTVPFDDPSPVTVALQHINLEPPSPRKINPNLNLATEAVLMKSLSKSPSDRYQSGEHLINALEEALAFHLTTPAEIRPLPPPPAGVQMQIRRLSQKTMVERVISHMEIPPKVTERDKITRESLERAINLLATWQD
jgi:serine/threonine protein kinase